MSSINESGKVMFVRDAEGELHVVKPGQPLPAVAQPPSESEAAAAAAATAGEQDGFFSESARRTSQAVQPTAAAPSAKHPLLTAARAGDDAAVRAACQLDPDAVQAKDHLERTALHLAAYAGHSSTVELLLAFGAHHSSLACDATMPIHFAAQTGHIDVCKLLLKAGAKINSRGTKRNDTPLHLSAFKGHVGCVEYLLKKNADARLKNRLQRTAMDITTDDHIKEILEAAALKKRKKQEASGPLACAHDDDTEDADEAGVKRAKHAANTAHDD